MSRVRVCTRPGCPQLQPCPTHQPPRASWSPDRDREAQRAFRNAVLDRDGHACTRCGRTHQLVAHHVRPGYSPAAGITLCRACHRIVDRDARLERRRPRTH